MSDFLGWLAAHDKLAGWAQFAGAILALAVTYFTAFAPQWRRKRQLQSAATRLLSHGYEVIESYHRALQNFAPFALSVRQASLSMTSVIDEMSRFPIFELDSQGPNSTARRLVAMAFALGSARLVLDATAEDIQGRTASDDEHAALLNFIADRLEFTHAIVLGMELKRPDWPNDNVTSAETP